MATNQDRYAVDRELLDIDEVLQLFWPDVASHCREKRLLIGGHQNRNFLLDCGEARFVLRRYLYSPHEDAIAYEHLVLSYLPQQLGDATIPKPVAANGSTLVKWDASYYSLFPFIKGAPFERGNLGLLENAGHLLAEYHNAVRCFMPEPRQRPTYGTLASLDWVARHCSSLEELWHRARSLSVTSARDQRILSGIDSLAEEARKLNALLTDDAYASLPQLVVHNDFGPQNLICSGNAVVGVLDFDFMAWDARVVDLAMALTWFGEDPTMAPPYTTFQGDRTRTLNKDWSRAIFRGYRDALDAPLTGDEIRVLPYMLRACAMSLAIWDLDHKIAGIEWYDKDLVSLFPYLAWLQSNGSEYVNLITE